MTTIQPYAARPVFTLINTFEVEPEKRQDVIASLRDVTERVMRHLPGYLSANVHESVDGKYVVNYVQWESRAHFDAMFQNPEAKTHMDELGKLVISVTPRFYTVAYAHSVS